MKTMQQWIYRSLKRYALGWIVIALGLIALGIGVSSCSDDDSHVEASDPLVGTWAIDANGFVKKDEVDVTADYTGLQLTFAEGGTYATKNAGVLLESSGTWERQDNLLTLDGDFGITIGSVSTTGLSLQFTKDDDDLDGREKSVLGEYEIQLTAQ